jgi:hypothetical protein
MTQSLILQVSGVWQKPEFILAGNFVYVGLLLIPRKKQDLTQKTQSAAATIGAMAG